MEEHPDTPARRTLAQALLEHLIALVYGRRGLVFIALVLATLLLGAEATRLRPDAGFDKQLPLDHPYMQVFRQYEKRFGGANLISIALMRRDGTLYDAHYLDVLRKLTDATFFLPGVDRAHVSSLFTPDLTYFEIVEGGIELGNIIPRDYAPTPEMLDTVRAHVAKSGLIGRYVASDETGSLIVAELLEHHPVTGERLDYHRLATQLEDQLRGRVSSPQMYEYRLREPRAPYAAGDVIWRGYTDYGWQLRFQTFEATQRDADGAPILVSGRDVDVTAVANPDYSPDLSVHIIGFAKVIGDVTDASLQVTAFFGLAVILTVALLWLFCGSLRLSLLPLTAALTAVVWELGLLHAAGYGLDPFAILVPFLILSIGVSHGVQYINGWAMEVCEHGRDAFDASVETFRRLFLPGTVAIVTNVIGFATLMFIKIPIVREMAVNAALGMAAVIITNKLMLPIALTWLRLPQAERFRSQQRRRRAAGERLWHGLAAIAAPRPALITLTLAGLSLGWALWMYPKLTIGDSQTGVPELRADSRYNRDSAVIVDHFAIGVDVLKVIAEGPAYGCTDAATMDALDRFTWRMQNTEGVRSAVSLASVAREVRGLWNEGAPQWTVLPRNSQALAQLVGRVPSGMGLQNDDCSAMPALIFAGDHRATTLSGLTEAVRRFEADDHAEGGHTHFALASGNLGVMAATNEEIRAREIVVILWVHLTLLVFVWLSFRSLASVICIIVPLVLCSLLTYGFMATLGIGMKSATLPVAAFGVGIGVDDGIYLWGALRRSLARGASLCDAFLEALRAAGKATTFTSMALIASVATWLFSGLQFQADMGLLLLFMFSTNLIGALLLMPALGWLCNRVQPLAQGRGGMIG